MDRGDVDRVPGRVHLTPRTVALASVHCALIPAARITFPHFSVYSMTNLPKSVGEPAKKGSAPKSASRALNVGSTRAAFTSLLRVAMTSGGVFTGAPMPSQLLAS